MMNVTFQTTLSERLVPNSLAEVKREARIRAKSWSVLDDEERALMLEKDPASACLPVHLPGFHLDDQKMGDIDAGKIVCCGIAAGEATIMGNPVIEEEDGSRYEVKLEFLFLLEADVAAKLEASLVARGYDRLRIATGRRMFDLRFMARLLEIDTSPVGGIDLERTAETQRVIDQLAADGVETSLVDVLPRLDRPSPFDDNHVSDLGAFEQYAPIAWQCQASFVAEYQTRVRNPHPIENKGFTSRLANLLVKAATRKANRQGMSVAPFLKFAMKHAPVPRVLTPEERAEVVAERTPVIAPAPNPLAEVSAMRGELRDLRALVAGRATDVHAEEPASVAAAPAKVEKAKPGKKKQLKGRASPQFKGPKSAAVEAPPIAARPEPEPAAERATFSPDAHVEPRAGLVPTFK